MATKDKPSRRQQILEALAHLLETHPGERITTAGLAQAVGVSEAALYRHFPSKAKMFDGLLEFVEETIFTLINRILSDEQGVQRRSEKVMGLLLGFSERNPGITRILTGDALVGETERLHSRVNQFFGRLETQMKQILREGQMHGDLDNAIPTSEAAGLLMAVVAGRMQQYVRSGFDYKPTNEWEKQWIILSRGVFSV